MTFDEARRAVAGGLPVEEAARRVVEAMTPEERLWCLDGDQPGLAGVAFMAVEDGYHRAPFPAAVVERLGVPGVAFADGPRGCVLGNATCFPVPMARGATWDPDLEERVGDAIGRELRASGATLTGAVCVNLLRHPAWGRAQETYGEEPLHVGELGAALTRGLQRHVLACVKHFACNSMENARFRVDVEVDEVALHEVYLPHFRRVVDEGVAAVMAAYNRVGGDWCGESRHLLTEVLRDEWGFAGFTISDFVFGLRDAAASLAAGLDVEMPGRLVRAHHLRAALDRGDASWADVDRSAERVVATLLRFDGVLSRPAPDPGVVGGAAHRALAREVAARSVVLLRNEPVGGTPLLPLRPELRVAVVGRLAAVPNVGDRGSSDVWDLACRTVLDAATERFAHVVHADGSDPAAAAAAATESDVAIVVVGCTDRDEGEYLGDAASLPTEVFPPADEPDVLARFEAWRRTVPPATRPPHRADQAGSFGAGGDRASLRLPAADVDLIRTVAEANPRTVVVVQAGSAVLCSEWVERVPAVALAWYGGCEAGPGLLDVLLGDVDATGRLPFTIPAGEADLPPFDRDADRARYDRWHGWRHLARQGRAAAFPFGFGLSYTTFELAGVAVDVDAAGGRLVVRGEVRNTGGRAGSDVVQVYAELPDPDRPPRLVGFRRVEVAAGGTVPIEVEVPLDRLATRDPAARRWLPPSGTHRITVARHAADPHGTTIDVEV